MEIIRGNMIANDQQLQTTLDRIAWFQNQTAQLRKTEKNAVNYRAAVSGFLAEIDRMQLEVCPFPERPHVRRPCAAGAASVAGFSAFPCDRL